MKRRQFPAETQPPLYVMDPEGTNPICKNALGTYACERCGRDVREVSGVCPAVPAEQRWRFATPKDHKRK